MTSSFDAGPEGQANAVAFVSEGGASEGASREAGFEAVPWFESERWAETHASSSAGRWPEFTQLAEEAYAAGHAHGRAELPWSEAERFEQAAAAFECGLEKLVSLRRNYLMSQRTGLIELALSIAETLVRRQIEADPEALTGMLERALGSFEPGENLCLRLSEREYEVLESSASDVSLDQRFEAYTLRVEPDPQLGCGDVRVIAEKGAVDARLASLLEQVREALRALVSNEGDCE